MSDIVERLRLMPSSLNDALRTMDEAADEIKRLRDELKLAKTPVVSVEDLMKLANEIRDELKTVHKRIKNGGI